MKAMKTTIEHNSNIIDIITEYIVKKVPADYGVAPWKIGTAYKSCVTYIYVNGVFACNNGFSHKVHKKGGIHAKNQLSQLLSDLNLN